MEASLTQATTDLLSMVYHPLVQYGDAAQGTLGYWGTDGILNDYWDKYIGEYVFSFRYMPYILIGLYVFGTMSTWLILWLSYDTYWCLFWDANNGKGRQSACAKPVPDNIIE